MGAARSSTARSVRESLPTRPGPQSPQDRVDHLRVITPVPALICDRLQHPSGAGPSGPVRALAVEIDTKWRR